MIRQLGNRAKWDIEVDLVCAGSSSGGLTAAIVGHDLGLSTVVLEKADSLGGATAISGGVVWIPFSHHLREAGLADSREEAQTYVRGLSLGRHDERLLSAYLDHGPEVIRYLEEHTCLRLVVDEFPDYFAQYPGGKVDEQLRSRKLKPDPEIMPRVLAQAEKTHPFLHKVRPDPIPYFLGKRDFWAEGRGLIGPLVLACLDRGINILTNTPVRQLIVQDGTVVGVRAERDGQDFFVRGKKGTLLATGGYEWNEVMWKRFMGVPFFGAYTPPTNEGDGHIMGMEVGAAIALMDVAIIQLAIGIPGEERDGKPFCRSITYGQPGNILVNRHGKRCCHDAFWPAIRNAFANYDTVGPEFANAPIFWISDQSFKDRWQVATVRKGMDTAPWLHRADTLPELAEQLGIPPNSLVETVERFNRFAREGRDPDFHRGESPHDLWFTARFAADHKPKPILGPLEKPPFYGMQVRLASYGNLGGLVTNASAQVIDVRGEVIPGLYCTSNTQAMLPLGHHYDSGAAHGKSMIFGYLAARHAARGGE